MCTLRRTAALGAGCCLLAAALGSPAPAAAQPPASVAQGVLADLEVAVGGPVRASVSERSGLVTFLSFEPHQQTLGRLPSGAPAEARARAFLDGYGRAFGLSRRDALAFARAQPPDEVGLEQVRFRQMHGGVPVTGGELTVHLRGSDVVAVNAKTVAGLDGVATVPVVTAAEAAALAAAVIQTELGVTDAELSTPRLELLNKGHLGGGGFATTLAWFVEARKIDLREYVWIDAIYGRLVLRFSQLTDAKDRRVHDTASSSTLPGPLVRSEGAGPTGDTDVDAAYDFSGDTYDHFFNVHGRDSYDGAGAPLISTVDYCPSPAPADCPFKNAFWNGTQMVYGAGFPAADDVDAHELTHAVTEFTANLFYYMQSGALNESYSDIFGETVDLLNGAGTDAPDTARTAGNCSTFFPGGADNSYRWLMGEDVPGFGAIRDMWNPTCFGDPGKMSDGAQFVCGDPGDDAGGVHTNSGVPNHAFALMVDGGTYNGRVVSPGLGLTKASKIQYRALANYLLSASDFLDNYNALLQACDDLVGTAGITATDCGEVKDALDAVEMSAPWPCSPTQAAAPAFCPASQAPEIVYFTDIESVGFMACSPTLLPTDWCKSGPSSLLGAFATSGVHSFWGYNRPSAGFISVSDTTEVLLPAGARMQFNHSFGFENSGTTYWDGGQIRYSTDNGMTDPWPDAGPLITAGQTYGGMVGGGSGNPLNGMSAFVDDSFGYTATQLDLSSLAGEDFRYQFYIGTDTVVDDYGWFVDDIHIYTCAECPATRMLDNSYNGTAELFKATGSITAGDGFEVGFDDTVTLQSPSVVIENFFEVVGDLTVSNDPCP